MVTKGGKASCRTQALNKGEHPRGASQQVSTERWKWHPKWRREQGQKAGGFTRAESSRGWRRTLGVHPRDKLYIWG